MMPNFLVIGAAKAGTSSLYEYLKQHPQIHMSPRKEPNFFAVEGEQLGVPGAEEGARNEWITDIGSYRALFAPTSTESAIGEASVLYLYSPKAPERIQYHIPDAKLIAILRHPVDRAYSAFCFWRERGVEPLTDFTQALEAEEVRIRTKRHYMWHYKQMGFYYTQLKRYLDRFDREQIRIYLYEDFNADNVGVVQDIFRFLDVDSVFIPDTSLRYLVSGIPKNQNLHAFFVKPNPIRSFFRRHFPDLPKTRFFMKLTRLNLTRPPLPLEVRRQLIAVYREDILNLQDLLQRDLAHWLQ